MKKLVLSAVVIGALSACSGGQNIGQINSEYGPITCDFYWDSIQMLDQAISVPSGISKSEADRLCKAEGERRG